MKNPHIYWQTQGIKIYFRWKSLYVPAADDRQGVLSHTSLAVMGDLSSKESSILQ